jgi:DeoR/GlpR family transcriptional regulator of sugar metabolism
VVSEERKERTLRAISEGESIKTSDYMKLNGVKYHVAIRDLKGMIRDGLIVRQSGGRGSSYKRL